jgi:hypothetical protein
MGMSAHSLLQRLLTLVSSLLLSPFRLSLRELHPLVGLCVLLQLPL